MKTETRPFAVVTGASSGIGLELAKVCAQNGFDLLLAPDRPFETALGKLTDVGASVTTAEADLATTEGVEAVLERIGNRQMDVLVANAGHGLGKGFLD